MSFEVTNRSSRLGKLLYGVVAAIVLLTANSTHSTAGEPARQSASCELTRITSTDALQGYGLFQHGEGICTYFDPAEECGTPAYPFEFTEIQFMVASYNARQNDGNSDIVDIVVFDVASPGDSCPEPGVELYRQTVDYSDVDAGYPVQYSFAPGALCVNGPFFAGFDFPHGSSTAPVYQTDDPLYADRCENYVFFDLQSLLFTDGIDLGIERYPAVWVFGRTDQCGGCCGKYTDGYTGNTNCSQDGKLTLSDITILIDRVYMSREPLCCEGSGNTNGSTDCEITLSDITVLIDAVYISKAPPEGCMPECET